ncbi:MAG: hypothetical protein ACOCV1_03980 [Bacillota bacterium]
MKNMFEFGILNVLYYRCYNASLLSDFKKMKMYFNLLEKEYQKDTNLFQRFITREKFENIKKIKKQIDDNQLYEFCQDFKPLEHEIEMDKTEIEKEKLIVRKIAQNQSMLEPFLGEEIKLKNLEHPCGNKKVKKDRCDMVSINKDNILFPIEFKLKKATHAVVGQINKYCLHFKLKLINNLYQEVQGVVIANSYSQYAINELKKKGHICLLHSGTLDDLRLNNF